MTLNKTGSFMRPCGSCENCLKRATSNWSFRLMQEDKHSLSSYFITLTYDALHIHLTKNGFMGLHYEDLQRFTRGLKERHRRKSGELGQQFKYFGVGEYGGTSMRPHYHIIAFNWDLSLLLEGRDLLGVKSGCFKLDGEHEFYGSYWPHGHITIGQVSGASVGYTMKYISKPSKIPLHKNDDRLPERAFQSKGLGLGYLDKMAAWHLVDMEKRQYVNGLGGEKYAMPRYYKKKLLELQEKENLKAWNVLESMKEQQPKENTARERSEAIYAGLDRVAANYKKGQKL